MDGSSPMPDVVTLAPGVVVHLGDVLAMLARLATGSVHCVVTSPPYLDARDYGVAPTSWPEVTYRPRFDLEPVTVPAMTCCLGHEPSLLAYVGHLVVIARELRRVLRPDGTLWLNLGAGYSSGTTAPRKPTTTQGDHVPASWSTRCHGPRVTGGLPAKQLIPVPSAVCDALQADGWFVRNSIVWAKPNAKPDSTTDRCTAAHESVFLLTTSPRYFCDTFAIGTPAKYSAAGNRRRKHGADRADPGDHSGASVPWSGSMAHPRDVWTIAVGRCKGAHFATFATELPRRCILAGSSEVGCCPTCGRPWQRLFAMVPVDTGGGRRKHASNQRRQGATGALAMAVHHERVHVGWTLPCACPLARPVPCVVLDLFAGSGTTLAVAYELGRHAVGIDAQPAYLPLMRQRIADAIERAAMPVKRAPRPVAPAQRDLPLGGGR